MMIYHMSTFQKIYITIYLTKQTLLWWNKKTWRLTVIVQVTKFLNTFVIKTKLRKWKLTNLDYHFIFLNYSPFIVWIRPSLFYFFDVSTIYQQYINMTVMEFFGCTFIAFGPPFALFVFTIARDPLRIIVLIARCYIIPFVSMLFSYEW